MQFPRKISPKEPPTTARKPRPRSARAALAHRAGAPLRIVADQTGRPTWARTLAATVLELTAGGARGVWHVADAGATTWHAFALAFLEMAGVEAEVEAVTSAEYGAPAERPAWSVLDTAATEAFLGRPMTPWREAVRRYLAERGSVG